MYALDTIFLGSHRAINRGEEVPETYRNALNVEVDTDFDRLHELGLVSTSKPKTAADVVADLVSPTTIADFSDEELLAEVGSRGLLDSDGTVDYDELDKADLEKLADERELEVEGTGSKGAVTKDDLVKALHDADAG